MLKKALLSLFLLPLTLTAANRTPTGCLAGLAWSDEYPKQVYQIFHDSGYLESLFAQSLEELGVSPKDSKVWEVFAKGFFQMPLKREILRQVVGRLFYDFSEQEAAWVIAISAKRMELNIQDFLFVLSALSHPQGFEKWDEALENYLAELDFERFTKSVKDRFRSRGLLFRKLNRHEMLPNCPDPNFDNVGPALWTHWIAALQVRETRREAEALRRRRESRESEPDLAIERALTAAFEAAEGDRAERLRALTDEATLLRNRLAKLRSQRTDLLNRLRGIEKTEAARKRNRRDEPEVNWAAVTRYFLIQDQLDKTERSEAEPARPVTNGQDPAIEIEPIKVSAIVQAAAKNLLRTEDITEDRLASFLDDTSWESFLEKLQALKVAWDAWDVGNSLTVDLCGDLVTAIDRWTEGVPLSSAHQILSLFHTLNPLIDLALDDDSDDHSSYITLMESVFELAKKLTQRRPLATWELAFLFNTLEPLVCRATEDVDYDDQEAIAFELSFYSDWWFRARDATKRGLYPHEAKILNQFFLVFTDAFFLNQETLPGDLRNSVARFATGNQFVDAITQDFRSQATNDQEAQEWGKWALILAEWAWQFEQGMDDATIATLLEELESTLSNKLDTDAEVAEQLEPVLQTNAWNQLVERHRQRTRPETSVAPESVPASEPDAATSEITRLRDSLREILGSSNEPTRRAIEFEMEFYDRVRSAYSSSPQSRSSWVSWARTELPTPRYLAFMIQWAPRLGTSDGDFDSFNSEELLALAEGWRASDLRELRDGGTRLTVSLLNAFKNGPSLTEDQLRRLDTVMDRRRIVLDYRATYRPILQRRSRDWIQAQIREQEEEITYLEVDLAQTVERINHAVPR